MPNAAILLECDLTGGSVWLDTAAYSESFDAGYIQDETDAYITDEAADYIIDAELGAATGFPDHYWIDTSDHCWIDGTVLRASQEGYADTNYWGAYILSVDPPQWQIATPYGGYCKLGWGSIRLAQEFFDTTDMWPPPTTIPMKFYYTPGAEASKEAIFEGTAHLTEWDRDGVTYELHGWEYDIKLLSSGVDYDGDTVEFPIAILAASYQPVTRMADVGGYPTYSFPFLYPTASFHTYVYDDGVDVTSNAIINGDGTFSLTVDPVGEVTISGINDGYYTLSWFFVWACGPTRLNLKLDMSLVGGGGAFALRHWASSQRDLLDVMSDVAAWFRHLFYIKDGTLYLVSMDSDNGTATYTQHDIGPVTYTMNQPISKVVSRWTGRKPVEETIGKYVKDIDYESCITTGGYSHGEELDIIQHSTDQLVGSFVPLQLVDILADIQKINATLPIPMAAGFPVPGKAITWTEPAESDGGPHVRGITGTIRARTITFDFQNYVYKVTGEGTVSAT
jgi:hypothetical protein